MRVSLREQIIHAFLAALIFIYRGTDGSKTFGGGKYD